MSTSKLRIGDRVIVNVVESLSDIDFIVNLEGALFRVKNTSSEKIKVSQSVKLKVFSTEPLSFILESKNQLKRLKRIDRQV